MFCSSIKLDSFILDSKDVESSSAVTQSRDSQIFIITFSNKLKNIGIKSIPEVFLDWALEKHPNIFRIFPKAASLIISCS